MKTDLKKAEEEVKIRQILIETDGKQIWIRKAETSKIELVAICNMIVAYVSREQESAPKVTE